MFYKMKGLLIKLCLAVCVGGIFIDGDNDAIIIGGKFCCSLKLYFWINMSLKYVLFATPLITI